jgi:hypothetical protein
MDSISIKKNDLIALLQLAQKEDTIWTDHDDSQLGELCRKFNNIHIAPPVLEGEFTSRIG